MTDILETQHTSAPEFEPISKIGQHILLDTGILEGTVKLIPTGAQCVEIGPGPGALTQQLLKNGNAVTAYEVDERCQPYLDALTSLGSLQVHYQNFLSVPDEDINNLGEYHLTGNIPYQISEPLLTKMTGLLFSSAVLLVGERMANAVTAPHPDHRSWSRMSLTSQAYFDSSVVREVPRTAFDPIPRTDGALILQTRKDANPRWKSDAVTRSYRSIVDANRKNASVAKALRSVAVDAQGNAVYRPPRRSGSQRSERRITRASLRDYTAEYNANGDHSRSRSAVSPTASMLSLVGEKVDDHILSRPLSGLSNNELRRLCAVISSTVNQRKKRR